MLDFEKGYVVTPMARGLRLTTGAEFARRDDPPSSAHLDRLEPFGREMFPLGERRDAAALARPTALPARHAADHRPARRGTRACGSISATSISGLTLGPISGRLLAEMMTGEATFVDPAPFRAERFA